MIFKIVFDEIGRITERLIYNFDDKDQLLRRYTFKYLNNKELNYSMIDFEHFYSFDILAKYNYSGLITEYIEDGTTYFIKYNSLNQIVDFYGLFKNEFKYDNFGNVIYEYCIDNSGPSDEEPWGYSYEREYKYDQNLNWTEQKIIENNEICFASFRNIFYK